MKLTKKTYKTYSRKKPCGKAKATVINVNIINLMQCNITNITNNYTNENQTRPETTNSESGDSFDKLLKGPVFNANNPSSPSVSNVAESSSESVPRPLFFRKRQDTVTFYRSDGELSLSTNVTGLFKDSKDSDVYSPLWASPDYCRVKNKLVEVKKGQKIIINKKDCNRIRKKRPVGRKNKIVTKEKSSSCISSTPTKPNTALNPGTWLETHFSPIMPPQFTPKSNFNAEDKLITGGNPNTADHNPGLGLSALLEGFGNLVIKTPHCKKSSDVKDCVEEKLELFDYESPYSIPTYRRSEEANRNGCLKLDAATPRRSGYVKTSEVMNLLQVEASKSPQVLISVDSCESIKENVEAVASADKNSSHQKKKLSESIQPVSKSPLHLLMNNSKTKQDYFKTLPISSPCPNSFEGNNEKAFPSRKMSSFTEKDINNKLTEESVLKNNSLATCNEMNSDPTSVSKLKSGNVSTASLEKHTYNCDFNLSLPVPEEKSNPHDLEGINKCENVVLERHKNDSNHSCSSKIFEPPVKELKIRIEEEGEMSQRYIEGSLSDESCFEKPPQTELKTCASQPFSDLTNLPLDSSCCEQPFEATKQSMSYGRNNKKTDDFSLKDKLILQPTMSDLNDTLVRVTLEAGKKWRRSFLRQKPPEIKFDRRVSLSADTLVKLIKEASILSCATNDTKVTHNNTTRLTDSILEVEESQNSTLPVLKGSPVMNFSFSKFSRVHTRRRRNYIFDMNEIPEENSDHGSVCNKTETCEQESMLAEDQERSVDYESADVTVNRTYTFETPPILKMNPEALSAITDRKRSRRFKHRSWGECSVFSDFDEQNEILDEETSLFKSCCSKLELEDGLEFLNEEDIKEIGKIGFLLRCGQQGPMSFTEAFPDWVLEKGKKIGEGVFGEVFMLERLGEGRSVIKIIPVEGSQLVNGEPQKRFDEVLSELIITEELSLLQQNALNCTNGFCELKNKFFIQGEYPAQLLKLWHEFDAEKASDNECPDMFGPDQLYLALELAHAGEPVESFSFRSTQQALAVFLQTTFSLAVAESATEFEHRDLHIGNVLVQITTEKYITFILNGQRFECPTYGSMVTIIDYTLSRISFKGDVLYFDLEKDPDLFQAEGPPKGDYQFDIYRHMRSDLCNNWRDHQPKTNIRWLHYLIDKLTSNKFKYKQKKTTKAYREFMEKLVGIKKIILDFYSATDLAQHLIFCYSETVALIKS